MNGGTAKGQADGFYLEALSKTTTMRDVNNRTILMYICELLKKDDEKFVEIKNDFNKCYFIKDYTLKDEETKLKEVRGALDKAKNNYDTVVKLSEGQTDPFIYKIAEFLQEVQKQMDDFEKKLDNLKKTYAEMCEYFLIDKNDEKAQNSQEFFKFFCSYFDQIVKSMPKEEKKKNPPASGRKVGQKIEGMESVVNELKSKIAGAT